MARLALQAISGRRRQPPRIGIHVTRAKAAHHPHLGADDPARAAVLYAQYQLYVNPDTVSGIGISLQMVFRAIAAHVRDARADGPARPFTLLLAEGLRLAFGKQVPRARQHALRRDAGAVHHLHAEGILGPRSRLAREDGEADGAQGAAAECRAQ